MSTKNSIDTIGNQTCDIQPCRALPQPTAPPRPSNNVFRLPKIYYLPPSFTLEILFPKFAASRNKALIFIGLRQSIRFYWYLGRVITAVIGENRIVNTPPASLSVTRFVSLIYTHVVTYCLACHYSDTLG